MSARKVPEERPVTRVTSPLAPLSPAQLTAAGDTAPWTDFEQNLYQVLRAIQKRDGDEPVVLQKLSAEFRDTFGGLMKDELPSRLQGLKLTEALEELPHICTVTKEPHNDGKQSRKFQTYVSLASLAGTPTRRRRRCSAPASSSPPRRALRPDEEEEENDDYDFDDDEEEEPLLTENYLAQSREEDDKALIEFELHNKERDDQSFYLVHFTKSDRLVGQEDKDGVRSAFKTMVAHERFEKILHDKKLYDCALPHLPQTVRAVCFTEMTPPSLSSHAENYSPWGFGFHKSFLYNVHSANPVMYCRDELWQRQKKLIGPQPDILRYYTPLRPKYDRDRQDRIPIIDYMHEREWRTPGPAPFSWKNLAFVYVPSVQLFQELSPDLYQDLSKVGVEIKTVKPVREHGRCNQAYSCSNGLRCKFDHTYDQDELFLWYKRNGWRFDGDSKKYCPPAEEHA